MCIRDSPSPYGIGDLGLEARRFIDFLVDSGQHLWQLLPLTHTGFGDSPYQSFSAFAGQPLLISPDHLKELGLITDELLAGAPSGNLEHVDYSAVIPWKYSLLKSAYEQFLTQPSDALFQDFQKFCEEEAFWLNDYALYMSVKDANDGRIWLDWPEPVSYTHLYENTLCGRFQLIKMRLHPLFRFVYRRRSRHVILHI